MMTNPKDFISIGLLNVTERDSYLDNYNCNFAMKCVVVLLVALAAVVSGFQYTEEWEAWKKEHGRVYESDEIELEHADIIHVVYIVHCSKCIVHGTHA